MHKSKSKLHHFTERTSFGNTTKNPRIQRVILKMYTSKEDRKKCKGDINKKLFLKDQRKQYYWVS